MKNFPLKRKGLFLTFAVMLLTCSLPRSVLPQAATTTTTEIIQTFRREFVPCANGGAGELVEVSGLLHLQAHVTINPKWSIATFHFQLQRLTGVGVTSGDVYHGVGGDHISSIFPRTGETQTRTSVTSFQLIGPDNKFQIHSTTHMTINANGEFTSTVGNFRIDCN